ncbi:hypothetical protein BD560DRAFT_306242, partial [Blakeslea trispora]
ERASILDNMDSLRQGKLPTNHQLSSIIDRLLHSNTIENNKKSMSEDGVLLLNDFQQLLMTLQTALKTKNRDELFQSMIYHVRKSEEIVRHHALINQPPKSQLKTAADAVLKLAKLFLDDGGNVFDSDRHHQHDLQASVYLANSSATNPSAQVGEIRVRPLTPSSLYDKRKDYTPAISEDETQHKGDLTDSYHQSMTSYNQTINNTASRGKTTVHKYSATTDHANVSVSNEGQPENSDILVQVVDQLKKIMLTIQKNPEYQQAISILLTLFSDWGKRLTTNNNFQRFDRRRSSTVDPSEQGEYYLYTSSRECKTILEDWAQGKSLDPIIERGNNLADKMRQDNQLNSLCNKVASYIQQLLKEPDYLEADQSTKDGQDLVNQIRQHTFDQYRSEASAFARDSSDFINTISEDPISKDISNLVRSIHNHLWYDKNGYAAFKPQLLNDIRITLIPALIEQFHYIALPKIVYSDRQYEIALENLLLAGDTLLPKVFEIKIQDFLRFSPNKNVGYTNVQSMHIDMAGIQTVMEDVIFYYKKKSGFPRLTDSGVVSLRTDGEGLRLMMVVTSNYADQKHTFRLEQCQCVIDKLFINVKHSKHNMLYKVLNPVLTGIVKRQMAKSIETKMHTLFEEGDKKITK